MCPSQTAFFFFTFTTQLVACGQALRGSLVAGQQKGEGEYATMFRALRFSSIS